MKKIKLNKKIAILTATLNAEKDIKNLINSLESQTDKDFIWIVVDGCSKDNTKNIILNVQDIEIIFIQAPDFGIYDAFNRGIKKMNCNYYLTVGSDDLLNKNAIENYKKALIENNYPDFVAAALRVKNKIYLPKKGWGWLYGMRGESSGHSVGLLINKNLHKKFGFYSNKFPIAADQLFVKTALNNGARISRNKFIAGEFSMLGQSGTNVLLTLTDIFRVQVLTERYTSLQYVLFFVRILKYMFFSCWKTNHANQLKP